MLNFHRRLPPAVGLGCKRADKIVKSSSVPFLRPGIRCAPGSRQTYCCQAVEQAGVTVAPSNGSNGNGVAAELDERQEAAKQAAGSDPFLAYNLEKNDWTVSSLSVIVLGASGDLAKKKIFPALFALYYEGLLPEHFQIFGYARSKMADDEFREMIAKTLTCRVGARDRCVDAQDKFLQRCFYQPGPYDKPDGFKYLSNRLSEQEAVKPRANRMFFLSIPPNVFLSATGNAVDQARSKSGWTRVIVEKPFGRDSASSKELGMGLAKHLDEDQIYRIDHYLGKELIENLTVLRFSNRVFEPLWSRQYIRNVQIIFSENFGTEGRGGYFDQYGIIRDVIQNHLLQILALFAMEQPVSLDAEDIRNEKVKVLRSMKMVTLDDVVTGQYRARGKLPGYLDDETVPKGSVTPTFSAIAMFINNHRWDGVPFLLKAGKALNKRRAEIRVQFRHVPGNLYRDKQGADPDAACNELVIRIQPKEAIYLKINNKVPGLGLRLDQTRLDLQYQEEYQGELPDAYERLLLDVVNGDKRLFIRCVQPWHVCVLHWLHLVALNCHGKAAQVPCDTAPC
eukprot:GHRR01012519.1.p1 GENE.GHRR01012519.1~~GHRR01012519.1.p1  ORF type:complete len:565 (+),score=146.91 GHRR01012519.1:1727-3421(+)